MLAYRRLTCAAMVAALLPGVVLADEDVPATPQPQTIVEQITADATKLAPLVKSDAARTFLTAAARLPDAGPRTLYLNRAAGKAYTEEEYKSLPDDERDAATAKEFSSQFYYYTAYGSPLIYARPLDIYAEAANVDDFNRKRIFDFGYGGVGHLRMLASLGADAVGVDVEPAFRALYSQPGDQGAIRSDGERTGNLKLVHGQFPGDDAVRDAVGTGFDLIVSKNVLKDGYIHPARETDERKLIKLGVDDATFVRAFHDMLNPGGYVLIYNICPAQAPPDQPYIPWADGHCPFARDLIEKTGFEVVKWNEPDQPAVLDIWAALGYDDGQPREELSKDLYAWYTLLRKPKT
ncbi:MAG: hypothetical protein H6817_05070 [Phycisphaerales bacterium]|nr:hypothetical protein [Phycisphaerales bacterium]